MFTALSTTILQIFFQAGNCYDCDFDHLLFTIWKATGSPYLLLNIWMMALGQVAYTWSFCLLAPWWHHSLALCQQKLRAQDILPMVQQEVFWIQSVVGSFPFWGCGAWKVMIGEGGDKRMNSATYTLRYSWLEDYQDDRGDLIPPLGGFRYPPTTITLQPQMGNQRPTFPTEEKWRGKVERRTMHAALSSSEERWDINLY